MIHQEVPTDHNEHLSPVIKLIGVGGGGCNAVEQMVAADIHGVEFTCVNTDSQALAKYNPEHVIQLGTGLTRGLGAGTDPEVGRLAAEEDKDALAAAISNTDMLFLTAGMGGGTGTGAIPVIARIARELGVLTVAVVTRPFAFEGGKRQRVADAGIAELRQHVDSLIVVPNENLLTHLGPNITLIDAFAASNDVLTNAVQSIAELITSPGLINVDFADVKSVMTEMGEAMMSTGRGIGDYRARDAAIAATESPLLDEIDLKEARGILANITASDDLSMGEFQIVGEILDQITADDANVVIGTVFDQSMTGEIRVTVVATGLRSSKSARPASRLSPRQKQAPKKKKSGLFGFGSSKKDKRTTRPSAVDAPPPAQHAARQQDIYQSQSHQNQSEPVEPIVDQLADLELPPEPTIEHCNVCGNPSDTHTPNCPRGRRQTPFEISGENMLKNTVQVVDDQAAEEHYNVDHLRTTNIAPAAPTDATYPADTRLDPADLLVKDKKSPRPKAASRKEFTTGKKANRNKYIAGLVAGTVALFSVFYILMSNKIAVNNEVVDASQTSLAERKLKAANRRLTGIDE